MEDYKVAVGRYRKTQHCFMEAQFVEMNKNVEGYANKEFTIYEVDGNGEFTRIKIRCKKKILKMLFLNLVKILEQ